MPYESIRIYVEDYAALKAWAAQNQVSIIEAAGRAVDLAKKATRQELSDVVRERGVRRAEAEAETALLT